MKSIVIYYSDTGNTKRIAEAIHSGIQAVDKRSDLVAVGKVDVGELVNYELIGIGGPVAGFQEHPAVSDFVKKMPRLKGKYAFTFCTHGTFPGRFISNMVTGLRRKGLRVVGWNDWFGSFFSPLCPKPYYTDGHPDEIDLEEAREFGSQILKRSRKIASGESHLIPRLPRKDKYGQLYGSQVPEGVPKAMMKIREELPYLKPSINVEKCRYPKCSICRDHCPTQSIQISQSALVFSQTCGPCMLWLCEQLCPTGAMQVHWELIDKRAKDIKSLFASLAGPLKKNQDIRRFRSLVAADAEERAEPLYKNARHPRLIYRSGSAKVNR